MSKNAWVAVIIVAIVFGGGGYFVGKMTSQSAGGGRFAGAGGTFMARGGAGASAAAGARFSSGGVALGSVITKGRNSITVQLTQGPGATSTNGSNSGTKIVLFNPSTAVEKTVSGSMSDVTVGENVLVSGTANSDGSITAQSIQIRPAGSRQPGQ